MCRERLNPHRPSGLIGPERIAKLGLNIKEDGGEKSKGREAYDWGAALDNPLANQSASSASEKVVGLVYSYLLACAVCVYEE